MALFITSERFLAGVKRRISVPDNQALLTDADILALSNDVVRARMIPLFVSSRSDYFVQTIEISMTKNLAEYRVPSRSLARSLRDLKIKDLGGDIRDVQLLALEDAHFFPNGDQAHSFHFQNDNVVLVPTPQTTGTSLLFFYEVPPGEMVLSSAVATVSSVDTDTGVITISGTIPSTFTTSTALDIIDKSSGHDLKVLDSTPTAVGASTITVPTADLSTSGPSVVVAGDHVALAGETPIYRLPLESHPLCESLTCQRVLHTIGDHEGARALKDDVEDETETLRKLIEPRIRGETEKIVNRRNLLRGQHTRFYRWLRS